MCLQATTCWSVSSCVRAWTEVSVKCAITSIALSAVRWFSLRGHLLTISKAAIFSSLERISFRSKLIWNIFSFDDFKWFLDFSFCSRCSNKQGLTIIIFEIYYHIFACLKLQPELMKCIDCQTDFLAKLKWKKSILLAQTLHHLVFLNSEFLCSSTQDNWSTFQNCPVEHVPVVLTFVL